MVYTFNKTSSSSIEYQETRGLHKYASFKLFTDVGTPAQLLVDSGFKLSVQRK